MSDLAAFARLLATDTKEYVAGYVTKALGGLSDRLASLETHVADLSGLSIPGPPGPPGDVGPPGPEGAAADTERIKADLALLMTRLIREEVAKAFAVVPVPKDGRDGKDADLTLVKALVDASASSHRPELPDVAALVREEVSRAVEAIPVPQHGRDGKDADPEFVKSLITQQVATIPVPRDGKDVDPEFVKAEIARQLAAVPPPKDGRDGQDVDPEFIKAEIAKQVAALPLPKDGRDGKDGASIDPAIVDVMVSAQVERAVAAIPKPQNGIDGKSLTIEDVAPFIASEIQRAVSVLPKPKDGTSIVETLVDRHGHLIVTFSDGVTKDVGEVVGKNVDPADVVRIITEQVEQFPRPQDGKDGRDGLGFEDMDLVFDKKAGWSLRFSRDGQTKDFALPIPFWAGTYAPGERYAHGSIVNCKGVWIAEAPTYERPGEGATSWRLIAKNGRDGKDMIMGPDGPALRR